MIVSAAQILRSAVGFRDSAWCKHGELIDASQWLATESQKWDIDRENMLHVRTDAGFRLSNAFLSAVVTDIQSDPLRAAVDAVVMQRLKWSLAVCNTLAHTDRLCPGVVVRHDFSGTVPDEVCIAAVDRCGPAMEMYKAVHCASRVANVRLSGRDKIDYAYGERDAIVKIFTEYVHEMVAINRKFLHGIKY